jgi:hypothetical protein
MIISIITPVRRMFGRPSSATVKPWTHDLA